MQRRVLRVTLLYLVGLSGAVFIYYIRSLFIPFAIAVLIAYLIYPLIHSLESRGVSRNHSILTVYAAGIILAGIFLTLFIPALLKEAKSFGAILPVYGKAWLEVQGYFDNIFERVFLPAEAHQVLQELSGRIRSGIIKGLREFSEGLLGLLTLLPSFILAPFLAYYMIRDLEHIKKRFLAVLPPGFRNETTYLLREADLIFSKFFRGHLLISIIVGFLTGAGAALVGLRFAILIGIVTAVADLIPIFGPIIAAVPVVGLALAENRLKGLSMLAIYLLVQQLEGSVLAPRLLGDRVGLHPLAVILVLLIGGIFFGPLGLIFAVPVAGLLRVICRILWEKLV